MAGILDEFEKTLSKTSTEVQEHHNSTISAESSFQRVLKLHLSVIGWGSNRIIDEVENLLSDNSFDIFWTQTMWRKQHLS